MARESMGDDGVQDAYFDVLNTGILQFSASLKSWWRAWIIVSVS